MNLESKSGSGLPFQNVNRENTLTREEIIAEINKIPYWYHSIDVSQGIITPGVCKDQCKSLERLHLPPSLKGMTVLDVGAWDGFYSFEAERRGAERVLATDYWVWDRVYGMNGFLTAHRLLNSKVESMKIDPHEISTEKVGKFDITLFLGVYYHLKDPLTVLENLAKVTQRQIVVESAVIQTPGKEDVPLTRFVKGTEVDMDLSNWWFPNVECLVQTVEAAGFSRVDLVFPPRWYRAGLRSNIKAFVKDLFSPIIPSRMRSLEICRAVVHGFKQHDLSFDGVYENIAEQQELKRLGAKKFFPHEFEEKQSF